MTAQRFCLACALVFSLTACRAAENAAPPAPVATAAYAQTSLRTNAQGTNVLSVTPRYKLEVHYPALPADEAPLGAMLRKIGATAQRDFMQALPDPKRFPEFAGRQLQLRIDFKVVARTRDFVSVRETGFQDSGGAHPIPVDSTIVYDARAHHIVTLDDLFADADAARKALADYARAELSSKIMAQAPKPGEGSREAIREWKTNARKMIEDGTQPTEQNFANFIVRAGARSDGASPGLTLIFPPYQVAAYVYGTQTVNVPASTFAQYLNPQYRNAFISG